MPVKNSAVSKSTLFVGDLSSDCTEEDIEKVFSQYGVIRHVQIVPATSFTSLGYGLVHMSNPMEAALVKENLDGYVLCGKKIRIREAVVGDEIGSSSSPKDIQSKKHRVTSLPLETESCRTSPRYDESHSPNFSMNTIVTSENSNVSVSNSLDFNSNFHLTEGQSRRYSMAECENECSRITDNLFVGGLKVASSFDIIKKYNITRIVNCCNSVIGDVFSNKPGIEYLSFNMFDGRSDDVSWFVWDVIDFIENGKSKSIVQNSESKPSSNKANTLIHCEKGVSRSCSFAIAYMMWASGLRWRDAFEYVKMRRIICNPNTAFTCNIIEFDELLFDVLKYSVGNIYNPVTNMLEPASDKSNSSAQGNPAQACLVFRMAFHLPEFEDFYPVLKLCNRDLNSVQANATVSGTNSGGANTRKLVRIPPVQPIIQGTTSEVTKGKIFVVVPIVGDNSMSVTSYVWCADGVTEDEVTLAKEKCASMVREMIKGVNVNLAVEKANAESAEFKELLASMSQHADGTGFVIPPFRDLYSNKAKEKTDVSINTASTTNASVSHVEPYDYSLMIDYFGGAAKKPVIPNTRVPAADNEYANMLSYFGADSNVAGKVDSRQPTPPGQPPQSRFAPRSRSNSNIASAGKDSSDALNADSRRRTSFRETLGSSSSGSLGVVENTALITAVVPTPPGSASSSKSRSRPHFGSSNAVDGNTPTKMKLNLDPVPITSASEKITLQSNSSASALSDPNTHSSTKLPLLSLAAVVDSGLQTGSTGDNGLSNASILTVSTQGYSLTDVSVVTEGPLVEPCKTCVVSDTELFVETPYSRLRPDYNLALKESQEDPTKIRSLTPVRENSIPLVMPFTKPKLFALCSNKWDCSQFKGDDYMGIADSSPNNGPNFEFYDLNVYDNEDLDERFLMLLLVPIKSHSAVHGDYYQHYVWVGEDFDASMLSQSTTKVKNVVQYFNDNAELKTALLRLLARFSGVEEEGGSTSLPNVGFWLRNDNLDSDETSASLRQANNYFAVERSANESELFWEFFSSGY